MAKTVSLLELRQSAYLFSDDRPGGTDTYIDVIELNKLLNLALTELYDMLVSAREDDIYTVFTQFNTAIGTESYLLPDDHYQTRLLQIQWSPTYLEDIDQIQLSEIHWLKYLNVWTQYAPKGYRIMQGDLLAQVNGVPQLAVWLYPTPRNVVAVRHFYIPTCPVLENDGDTFDGVNGWEILVALKAARMMRAAGQNEASQLTELYNETYERIERMAADREAMAYKRIRNVNPEGQSRPWPWTGRRPLPF